MRNGYEKKNEEVVWVLWLWWWWGCSANLLLPI